MHIQTFDISYITVRKQLAGGHMSSTSPIIIMHERHLCVVYYVYVFYIMRITYIVIGGTVRQLDGTNIKALLPLCSLLMPNYLCAIFIFTTTVSKLRYL
jgi:hypothetical protein